MHPRTEREPTQAAQHIQPADTRQQGSYNHQRCRDATPAGSESIPCRPTDQRAAVVGHGFRLCTHLVSFRSRFGWEEWVR
jgi:hypothetical protein